MGSKAIEEYQILSKKERKGFIMSENLFTDDTTVLNSETFIKEMRQAGVFIEHTISTQLNYCVELIDIRDLGTSCKICCVLEMN